MFLSFGAHVHTYICTYLYTYVYIYTTYTCIKSDKTLVCIINKTCYHNICLQPFFTQNCFYNLVKLDNPIWIIQVFKYNCIHFAVVWWSIVFIVYSCFTILKSTSFVFFSNANNVEMSNITLISSYKYRKVFSGIYWYQGFSCILEYEYKTLSDLIIMIAKMFKFCFWIIYLPIPGSTPKFLNFIDLCLKPLNVISSLLGFMLYCLAYSWLLKFPKNLMKGFSILMEKKKWWFWFHCFEFIN